MKGDNPIVHPRIDGMGNVEETPTISASAAQNEGIKQVISEAERLEDLEEEKAAPPKVDTWVIAGLVVIAYQVGVGIMSLPISFVPLGYILGTVSIVAWGILACFIGFWMEIAKKTWPTSLSMGDVAFHAFGGSKRAKSVVNVLVYTNFFLLVGEFILVQSQSLGFVFYDVEICSIIWVVVVLAVLIPLLQFRVLSLNRWIMVINLILVTSALLIALISFSASDSQDESLAKRNASVSVTVNNEKLSIFTFFTAQALIAFSYSFSTMTLEVMSEMKHFERFTKSVTVLAIPVCMSLYLMSGLWGYSYLGSSASGLLISNIPRSPEYRVAAICLFIHISVTATVTGSVLIRAIHRKVSIETLEDFKFKGRMINLGISLLVTIPAAGMAIAIPIFDSLTSLIGSLIMPTLSFMLPLIFYVKAVHHLKQKVSWLFTIAAALITIFLLLLTIFGTVGTVMNIVNEWSSSSSGSLYAKC